MSITGFTKCWIIWLGIFKPTYSIMNHQYRITPKCSKILCKWYTRGKEKLIENKLRLNFNHIFCVIQLISPWSKTFLISSISNSYINGSWFVGYRKRVTGINIVVYVRDAILKVQKKLSSWKSEEKNYKL